MAERLSVVTGATGHVGFALIKELEARGEKFRILIRKESKMFDGAGLKQIWGEMQSSYSWGGDYLYNWAIPRTEIQMNTNLEQNDGWID